MAKKEKGLTRIMNFVTWLAGVLVSLSVGFSMIGGVLILPTWLGGEIMATITGWIVVISVFVGIVTAIFNK